MFTVNRITLSGLLLSLLLFGANCQQQIDSCAAIDSSCSPFSSVLLQTVADQARRLYVVAGQDFPNTQCNIYSSPDGLTNWFGPDTLPDCTDLNAVRYLNGIFIAVGRNATANNCRIFTSSDATTWTQQTCPTASGSILYDVALGQDGHFYAVGDADGAGAPLFLASSDTQTWTTVSTSGLTQSMGDIETINGTTYVAGNQGGTTNSIFSSTDPAGGVFTLLAGSTTAGSTRQVDLKQGSGPTDIVSITSVPDARFSSNGSSFSTATLFTGAPTSEKPQSVIYARGKYVALGGEIGGTELCWMDSSTDGINWTNSAQMTADCPQQSLPLDVIFSHGRFIATGYNNSDGRGMIFYSETGSPGSWSISYLSGTLKLMRSITVGEL